MKHLAWTLIATLLAGPVALAQGTTGMPPAKDPPPPTTAMSDKNKEMLDGYLAAWERRMAKLEGLETKIVLTEIEDDHKIVRTGDAALLTPNYARMLLKLADDPTNAKKWKHFSADGKFLREYDYVKKVAWTSVLPKEGIGDNTLMSFLFMTSVADFKKRYDLSIEMDDPKRFTDHYLFIEIRPKSKEDMQDFKKAELVLWKNNKDEKYFDRWMLPARLWFQQPNGNQIKWEFQNLSTQKKLLPRDFEAPSFPDKEWKPDWLKPPTPSVIRTSAPSK